MRKRDIPELIQRLDLMFPNAKCELIHHSPFTLLVATMLSAQTTDEMVNRVTKDLFQSYDQPEQYAAMPQEELEKHIRRIGLFRSKAKHIIAMSKILLEEYHGEVPQTREELVKLPGVGRKTANVVISNAFHVPAIAVDTHVERVSKRLGLSKWKDSVLEVEKNLMNLIPQEEWTQTHHRLIFLGRYQCKAQNPQCAECQLLDLCREGLKRMKNAD